MTKEQSKEARDKVRDKAAFYIATLIVRSQQLIVARLSAWERRLSRTQKKALLLLFCSLCGGYLLYVLATALFLPLPGTSLPVPDKVIPQLSLPPPAADTAHRQHYFQTK